MGGYLSCISRPNLDAAFQLWNAAPVMDLPDVRAFARVADVLSISAAARTLGAPKSSVSRSLSRLEAALGSVLVERSSRRLRLTDAGRVFLPHALRILDEVEDAEAVLGQFARAPRGTLRVSSPIAFTLGALAPMLPEFLARYPEVAVVFEHGTDWTAISAGNADLHIRIGPLPDSDMVTRRLSTAELWTCASPAYAAARGLPACPAELPAHDIVAMTGPEVTWACRRRGGEVEDVALRTRTVAGDPVLIRGILAAGTGIGQLPDYMAAEAIGTGALLRVLPNAGPATADVFALYSSHHSLPAKARVFIDALVVDLTARRAAFARSMG